MNLCKSFLYDAMIIALAVGLSDAFAQKYEYSDEPRQKREQQQPEEKRVPIGKKYWISTDRSVYTAEFKDSPQLTLKSFHVSGKASFEITEYVSGHLNYYYYKVIFEDGRVAFLNDIDFEIGISRGYISKENPDVIEAKKKSIKKAPVAKAERKAKGGVRLGMTKDQVLQSNWGKPLSKNRTIVKDLVHEQWVYDGGYLYFDNDVLTGIQD